MVDPNPARGMPLQLQRYWLHGKGAAKIRWDVPGDFMRCVRHLRKWAKGGLAFDPKGLCNILHRKATGGAPGHGRLESLHHSMDPAEYELALTAASQLMQAQSLGQDTWVGPIAPIGRPTGEPRRTRIFDPGSLNHRPLPIPLSFQRTGASGHMGAVTVGRVLGITIGPDEAGNECCFAWGDWLDPSIVPEVTEAKYLVDQGIVGPSVDPGGAVQTATNPETGAEHSQQYTIGRVTLVPVPAFVTGAKIINLKDHEWPEDDQDMPWDQGAELPQQPEQAGEPSESNPRGMTCLECGEEITEDGCMACKKRGMTAESEFSVNTSGWQGLPLAPRKTPFNADEAIARISQWAGVNEGRPDVAKLRQAFLWRDDSKPEGDPKSYRLPIGDVINGRLSVMFHAIYAAAALISGAHGGLPGISDADKARLRPVISKIYQQMAKAYNDTQIQAPWDRRQQMMGADMEGEEFAATPQQPYGQVQYADPGYQKDKKKRYPLDNETRVRAAWGYINQEENASKYNPKQLIAVRRRIIAAAKKLGIQIEEKAQEFSVDLLEPPSEWFMDPNLSEKTRLTVTPDGQVFGHLAAWDECHSDLKLQANQCYLPPRSKMDYAPFLLGEVYCADESIVRVGKIVMDTRHADISLGYSGAAIHYDNTGDEVAVVNVGEDQYGIWVAGAVVPEATRYDIAKLRRSPLSGDWRRINNNLELTAALAVNVPAFPIYSADGEDERLALVAAGTLPVPDDGEDELSPEQDALRWRLLEFWEAEELREQEELAGRFAALTGEDPGLQMPTEQMSDGLAMEADAVFGIVEDTPAGKTPDNLK